jgi:integrase/recombinase XerD
MSGEAAQKGSDIEALLWCFTAFLLGERVMNNELEQIRINTCTWPVSDLLEDYRLNLLALNRSPKTITWYMEILKRYFAFLEAHSLLLPIDKLGTGELKAYILHLNSASRWSNHPVVKKVTGKLSAHSVEGHVRAIKAFWGWLERENYIEGNRLAKFPLPKVPVRPVNILSDDQIKVLLNTIDRFTHRGAKYYLIILLMLDTGIRISELVHIKIEDIDLQNSYIRVFGKGQKWRTVPVSTLTKRETDRYLRYVRPQVCYIDSPYLFTKSDGSPISINGVQQFLRRLANRAGLNGVKASPHIWRHSFATHAIANGANVFVLKEIMGHSSLITTMKYTHLQPQDLQIQHAGFSPVAKLDIGRAMHRTRS